MVSTGIGNQPGTRRRNGITSESRGGPDIGPSSKGRCWRCMEVISASPLLHCVNSNATSLFGWDNGQDGRSPLHLAAERGLISCANILLQRGALVDSRSPVSQRQERLGGEGRPMTLVGDLFVSIGLHVVAEWVDSLPFRECCRSRRDGLLFYRPRVRGRREIACKHIVGVRVLAHRTQVLPLDQTKQVYAELAT